MSNSKKDDNFEVIDVNPESSIVTNIQFEDFSNDLHNSLVSDRELSKPRKLLEITASETPLIPIPQDTMVDTIYQSRLEPRCVLCRSPWRERAEHWYLEHGRKPHSVVNFFKVYFNVGVSWECVDTHMNNHCTLTALGRNGLLDLEEQEADMARWRYRELDLAITGTLSEINDVRSLSCKNKPDLLMKRAALLNQLYHRLVEYKTMREEASVNTTTDIFAILMEIYTKISDPASKQVLMDTVTKLREL